MAAGQLGNHFADYIVQVQAGAHIGQQHLVFCPHALPVAAVHVLQVIAVAESAPHLVEDLRPFLGVVDEGHHVGSGYLFTGPHLGAQRSGLQLAGLHHQGLLVAEAIKQASVGAVLVLAAGKIEYPRAAASVVPQLVAVTVVTAEASTGNRQLHNAVQDAVRIHFHLHLRAFLSGRSAFGGSTLGGRCFRLGCLVGLHLRIFGNERRRRILGQHGHIDATHVAHGKIPFNAAVLRVQVAVGIENEVLPIGTEYRGRGVVPPFGDGILLVGHQVIDVHHIHLVLGRAGIGNPAAVRGILRAPEFGFGAGNHHSAGAGGHFHLYQAVLAVSIKDVFAVRAPLKGTDIGIVVLGELHRGTTLGHIVQIDFRFTGNVADPGYPLAVRAPVGSAVVGTGAAAQVAGNALPDRHVKDFSARAHHGPVAVRRQGKGRCLITHLAPFGAGINGIGGQADGHPHAFPGSRIKAIDITAILKDDGLAVGGRKLYIVFVEVRNLAGLAGFGVVAEQVHDHVTVAGKENIFADPHGEDVLGHVVGNIHHGLGLGVPDPHVVGHAAAVVLPGAEFPHNAVVGQLLAVRAPGAEATFRQGNLFRHAAFRTHGPELSGEAFANTVAV